MKKYKKVYLEITNVCNLKCRFCPTTTRTKKYMDIDTFSHILDQIKPYTNFIYLHIKGEPLLHPNLDKLLDIAYIKGFKVNITTNGTLIEKVKDTLLTKPAIRQINISLHSLTENDFDDKTTYLKNIINFSKQFTIDNNKYISLRLWNLKKDNLHNPLNQMIFNIFENEFNLVEKIEDHALIKRGIELANNIFLDQDLEFEWPSLNRDIISENGFCYGLRTHVGILVDGTVVPCCLDGDGIISLGNILTTPFSNIINSERANNIYYSFSKNQAIEPLCKRCGFRTKLKQQVN